MVACIGQFLYVIVLWDPIDNRQLIASEGATLGGTDKSFSSLSVAVRSPLPPEEKREGGNVYEKLTRIVLCDIKVIYVSM